MEFILNSQNKKVEVFYKTAEEQMAILKFMSEYITLHEDSTHNLGVDKVTKVRPESGIAWANITPCELSSSSAVISTTYPTDSLTIKYNDIVHDSISGISSGFVTGTSIDNLNDEVPLTALKQTLSTAVSD